MRCDPADARSRPCPDRPWHRPAGCPATAARAATSRANWSMPGTSSSARCRAGSPRSSRRRSATGDSRTAISSARRRAAPSWPGLRYGEGTLYTKNAGDLRVYWQGPSVGFDLGGEGARTMMLVYNLPSTDAVYQRFGGIDGSAYFIGGFGMTALTADNIVVVPIRSGVGLPPRRQCRLPEVHAVGDLEPVLIRGRRRSRGPRRGRTDACRRSLL